MKAKGVMIVTNDKTFVRSQHYLISRGMRFKVVYIPVSDEQKQPVIMTEMNWWDRLLYRMTIKCTAESARVYG